MKRKWLVSRVCAATGADKQFVFCFFFLPKKGGTKSGTGSDSGGDEMFSPIRGDGCGLILKLRSHVEDL